MLLLVGSQSYRDFVVQELEINAHTTHYRLARWVTPEGEGLTRELPAALNHRHFGPPLVSYTLYQHHHCQTTQPLLLEQLREWSIDISAGQINELLPLLGEHDAFHAEKNALLQAGLVVSNDVSVADRGARHQGRNGYVTQIGNDLFAWFSSSESKSRVKFLKLLRAGHQDYVLTEAALDCTAQQKLPNR